MDDHRWAEEFLSAADMPHPPSRFLRLRHLPGDLSSFAFVERFVRALRAYGPTELISVLNAQHTLWICVEDARNGERAMAFFQSAERERENSGMEISFVSEDAFTEAGLYGSDIWHPTLTMGSESVTEVPMQVDEAPLPLLERRPLSALRAMHIGADGPAMYHHWEPYVTPLPVHEVPPTARAEGSRSKRFRRSRSLSLKARRALSRGKDAARRCSPLRKYPESQSYSSSRASSRSESYSQSRSRARSSSPTSSCRRTFPRSRGRSPRPPQPRSPRCSRMRRRSGSTDNDDPSPDRDGARVVVSPPRDLYSCLYHPLRPLTPLHLRETPPILDLGHRLSTPSPSDQTTQASRSMGDLLRRARVPLEERLRELEEGEILPGERKKRGRQAGKHNRLRR